MNGPDKERSTTLADNAATENLRLLVQERLRARRANPRTIPPYPEPRYDDVFVRGTEWLDALAAGVDSLN
jgi:hypothetical protein